MTKELAIIDYPASDSAAEFAEARKVLLDGILAKHGGELEAHYPGQMNDVLIVSGGVGAREVLKVPREDEIYADGADRLGALRREVAALSILNASGAMIDQVDVPILRHYDEESGPLLRTSFLPGILGVRYNIHAAAERLEYGLKERERMGRQLGAFMLRQAELVDPDLFLDLIHVNGNYGPGRGSKKQQPTETEQPASRWEHRIHTMVGGWTHTEYPETMAIFSALYDKWRQLRPSKDETPYFIHGDLHFGNLMLDNGGNLSGVFDYGEASVGKGTDIFAQEITSVNLMLGADAEEFRRGCLAALGNLAPSNEQLDAWFDLKLGHTIPGWLDGDKTGYMHPFVRRDFVAKYPQLEKELAPPKS